MKSVGMGTSLVNGGEEGFMPDESIQKLLNSDLYEDMLLGRIFLLKKYPKILENSGDHFNGDYSKWNIDNETVEEYSPIIMIRHRGNSRAITGFVIEKTLVDD